MRYVVASLSEAINYNINKIGHLMKGDSIILNEKEVMYISSANEDFEKGVLLLNGKVYTNTGINQLIAEGGWEYGRQL